MLVTNFDYIKNKSFSNNSKKNNINIRDKASNKKLEIKKKFAINNLEDFK